jgi:AcrR family transcriptional regulator
MESNMARKAQTRADPEKRRALILDEAIGLIGERGYYGFTVQELGRRCGLSNPGLLHHFPSKPAVLLAVLDTLEADETKVMTPIVQAALDRLAGADGGCAVLHVLRMIVARADAQPAACRLLAELQSESLDPAHPAHGWWLRREAAVLALHGTLLRPFVAVPDAVARQLLAMMDGLCVQWLRAARGFDVVAAWDDALARLLPELHATPAPDR